MAHSDDTRRAVRAAYVFDQLGLEIAAVKHDVPVATARRWKAEARRAGDDWDKARSAQMIAGGGIEDVVRQTLAVMVQQTQAAAEAIQGAENMEPLAKVQAIASLADSHTKMAAVLKRLMPETDRLAVALDVIRRLLEFTKARYPGNAAGLAEMLEAFGEEVVKAYG
ncbi:DUF1804 family protein [Pseudothauera rhizosphaerae]|uniref:DUF1804 family protein n=1 Tax=Pseudothauera rhizosphaerae TaxID=2565932 RepID=A0A4S4AP56_9RHOO|nr:DUF1804 family protein [Pseudothauera rhizosphaerae]THF60919.1 DUF1804 family protein [Pseudothauera rhizosphaerae]